MMNVFGGDVVDTQSATASPNQQQQQQQQWVPDWIRAHSDTWKFMLLGCSSYPTNDPAGELDRTCADMCLPVCGEYCMDARLYYRVISYWLVPLSAAPWHFVTMWFDLPKLARVEIVGTKDGAWATELGCSSLLEMVARMDDPAMLRKVPLGLAMTLPQRQHLLQLILHHDAVQCFVAVNYKVDSVILEMAVKYGALYVLKVIAALRASTGFHHEERCIIHNAAIKHSQLQVLQWAIAAEHTEIYCGSFVDVAKYGHWHVFEWLLQHGYTPDQFCTTDDSKYYWRLCLERAAEHGHLDFAVRLRREYACPWTLPPVWPPDYHHENICYIAAMNGHFELLKWATAEGCPWPPRQWMLNRVKDERIRSWIAADGPLTGGDEAAIDAANDATTPVG